MEMEPGRETQKTLKKEKRDQNIRLKIGMREKHQRAPLPACTHAELPGNTGRGSLYDHELIYRHTEHTDSNF